MRPPRSMEAVVTKGRVVEQRWAQRSLPAGDDTLAARIRFETRARVAEDGLGKELRCVVEIVQEVTDAERVAPAQLLIHLENELVGSLVGAARNLHLTVGEVGRWQCGKHLYSRGIPEVCR